jgi:RsiW-degrading membrane proteinase PrsW (M82 family)
MPAPGTKDAKPKKTASRYKPAHGRDFEIEIHAVNEYRTSRTRDRIAYLILAAVIVAMLVALVYGFWQQNFASLKDVWTVVGPLTGTIIGYSFHRGRKD